MARGPVIAIEFGQQMLRAMRARVEQGRLHVEGTLVVETPQQHADDPDALGQWVGEQLRQAGFARGRATWVLSRERVGFKRLSLPSDDHAELPDMVRLAMQRDLPFDAADAVIDFIPDESQDGGTQVVAIAAPHDAIAHTQAVAKASGFGIDRIAMRSMGTATLLSELTDGDAAGTLAIDVRPTSVEFAVIVGGGVQFSRAIELPAEQTTDVAAEGVITETQRTWMSYRLSQDAVDVQRTIIVGDEDIARASLDRVREILNRPVERIDTHQRVDCNGAGMHGLWPLAGVLLEPIVGAATLDFANPRKAPDLQAAKRKRIMYGSAIAALVMLAIWTVAKRDIDTLQTRVDELTTQRNDMTADYMRYTRDVLKRDHIEHWQNVHVDWLAHLHQLCDIAPDPRQVVLDQWSGALSFRGVQWDRRAMAGERWSAISDMTINVSGEAVDRATADIFRETLVNNDVYATRSAGTDQPGGKRLPFGFDYKLRAVPGSLADVSGDDRTALAQETNR